MIIYILKSTFCLVLLLGFYHLILEKEKMHQFNRFYLIGSILFSLLVPSFIITVAPTIIETPVFTGVNTLEQIPFQETATSTEYAAETIDYTQYILGIYILISAILFIVLSRKVYNLLNKVKRNRHINYFSATVVLLKERIVPYTFLHYIFINKHTYQTDKIEEQILTHELAHVEQKHSIDVLFIEVLQNLFWFNPIFRYYKKAMQLNHEFLADYAVIISHKNITEYQQVLLNTTAQNNNIYLASNLNYSLTKKRLLMMTKPSSKTNILLKKLLVAPLVAGFIFAFAQRVEAQENKDKPQIVEIKTQEKGISDKEMNEYRELISKSKNSRIFRYKQLNRMKELYKKMSVKQQNSVVDVYKLAPDLPPFSRNKKTPTKAQFNSWKNKEKFALWIDDKVVDNSVLNNYKRTDFPYFSGSFVHKNARKGKFPQEYQFHLYTHASFKKMKEREAKEKKNTITIFINKKGGLLVNGKVTTIQKLKDVLSNIDIDKNNAFVSINADMNTKVGYLTDVKEILRASKLYKISFKSKAFSHTSSKPQVREVKKQQKLQNENELLIFIKKDGKLIIKNKTVSYSNLKKILNREIKDINKARIILKTDPKAPLKFTHLTRIKNALRKNGVYAIRFQNFSFSPKEEIIIRKELSKKERSQVIEVVEKATPVKIEVIKNKKGLVEVIETPDWKSTKKKLEEYKKKNNIIDLEEVVEVEETTEVKELVEVRELKEVEEVIETREAHDLPEVVELIEVRELKEVVETPEVVELLEVKEVVLTEELQGYKKKNRIINFDYNKEAEKYILNTKRTKKEFQLLQLIYKNLKKIEREKYRSPTYIKNNINSLHKTLKKIKQEKKSTKKYTIEMN